MPMLQINNVMLSCTNELWAALIKVKHNSTVTLFNIQFDAHVNHYTDCRFQIQKLL